MTAYRTYLEMQKHANAITALGDIGMAAGFPLSAGGILQVAGAGLKGLGGLVSAGKPAANSWRANLGKRIQSVGHGVVRSGEKASDWTQNLLNKGPGIEYNANSLPGLMGFEARTGPNAAKKITKLTPARGLYWASNAAAAGTGLAELKNFVSGPREAPAPIKQAREDVATMIAFWESSV